jgi:hypothetical protein
LRYVEIKHGRVAMLAVLGHIVTTAGVRFPGDIDYRNVVRVDSRRYCSQRLVALVLPRSFLY